MESEEFQKEEKMEKMFTFESKSIREENSGQSHIRTFCLAKIFQIELKSIPAIYSII